MFRDRTHAGEVLAEHLQKYRDAEPVIIALPRGGVPVAREVASALEAPLDVLPVRKLGAPSQPEFGFGAIAGETVVLDTDTVEMLGLTPETVKAVVARERRELLRRENLFHAQRAPIDVQGRTVIIVDDGLATGVTARAAIRYLRTQKPQTIVFAAPVCASDSARRIADEANAVVCAMVPPYFQAVGEFYDDFTQTTDDEVLAILDEAQPARGSERVPVEQELRDEHH